VPALQFAPQLGTQRQQYGRAIRYGLTPEQAKQFGPACGKCTTDQLSPHRQRHDAAMLAVAEARAVAATTAVSE
jgi:hypothetical protein